MCVVFIKCAFAFDSMAVRCTKLLCITHICVRITRFNAQLSKYTHNNIYSHNPHVFRLACAHLKTKQNSYKYYCDDCNRNNVAVTQNINYNCCTPLVVALFDDIARRYSCKSETLKQSITHITFIIKLAVMAGLLLYEYCGQYRRKT
jgi:hypothetical protein